MLDAGFQKKKSNPVNLKHSRVWLAVGELGPGHNFFLRDFFLDIYFFGGLVFADWPPPLP